MFLGFLEINFLERSEFLEKRQQPKFPRISSRLKLLLHKICVNTFTKVPNTGFPLDLPHLVFFIYFSPKYLKIAKITQNCQDFQLSGEFSVDLNEYLEVILEVPWRDTNFQNIPHSHMC